MMPRLLTAGESHGATLVVIVDGLPAGIPLGVEDVDRELRRRQAGYGRGPRATGTIDRARLLAGVAGGQTTGAPVAIEIANPEPETASQGERPANLRSTQGERPAVPRPGHADLGIAVKYGTPDFWSQAERASARETAARVAGATVARALMTRLGVEVGSHVTAIGGVAAIVAGIGPAAARDRPGWQAVFAAAENDCLRCADPGTSLRMRAVIDEASARGDTLGGVFEVAALGCPPGLGGFGQWDRRLDARLAGAVMSVPGVKAVSIGAGFEAAGLSGRLAHDPVVPGSGPLGTARPSNLAGGLEGGITNGQPVVVRAAMKPIPSLGDPLPSVDLVSGEPCLAPGVRGDVCAVPASAVVAEAMVAWELAAAVLERYGSDTLEAVLEAWQRDTAAWRRDAEATIP
jgi:chorismate synthase